MATIANSCYSPLPSSSIHPRRLSITKPSFLKPLPFKLRSLSIRSSSSPSSSNAVKIAKHRVETLAATPSPNSSLRTALTAAVTVFAVFFTRFSHIPVLAAPSPASAESTEYSDEEVSSLRAQMMSKIYNEEYEESFVILKKLLEIQPEEIEWQIYKGQMLLYNGYRRSARSLFNDIIKRYPLRADAYDCLLSVNSRLKLLAEIEDTKNMMEEAMKSAQGENLRELKLSYAGYLDRLDNTKEALRVYDELIAEDPQDFRPYLGKWGVHTRSNEKVEAAECLEKYQTLVPKDHLRKKKCNIYVKDFQKECDDYFRTDTEE